MKSKKAPYRPGAQKSKPPKVINGYKAETWKYYLALAVILLISIIAYLPVFRNGISTWDDAAYIEHNPLIYSINPGEIFSRNVMGNYHPLTVLALALEYQLFGLNAAGYHAVNLLLHLLNVLLTFYVVFRLSNKTAVALVAALLFGIHPMHVESVAWVSELKDLLYSFFFLGSYLLYLKYLKDPGKRLYIISLVLFLASLLSKAMAASLPVVLILTDYFKGRKIDKKAVLEKVPFFLLAIAFGIIAVMAQKSKGATDVLDFTLPQRILFACYGYISYLYKLILPYNLSAYYPYPIRSGESIPLIYYGSVLIFGLLGGAVYYSLRYTKKVFFGLGFFTVTIFLVLQLFPVGSAIMADRYSYIPSIGIFFLAGEGFNLLLGNKLKTFIAIILLGIVTVLFSVKTYERCGVWKNDLALWNDVIGKYQNAPLPYNNRGYYLLSNARNNEALDDFNKSIELDPENAFAYNLRGMVFMHEQRNKEAIDDFNRSIELNPDNAGVYDNRGWVLMSEGRYEEALGDFNRAIELDPGYAVAYNDRGVYYINQRRYEEAIHDFNKAIELDPGYAEAYCDRGNVAMLLKQYEEAIGFYNKAIKARANYAEAYYYRGIAEYYTGKKDAGCRDLKQAVGLGYQTAADALAKMCK